MTKIFLKTLCFSLLLLSFMISNALARIPDSIFKKKNAVVTVFVDDINKRHVESGSGFIVHQDGVIVTNCRVIARWIKEIGSTLHVETDGGVSFPIEELISSKCENNLALFKIKANDLPAVKLAKDYNPRPGEKIAVIKNPSESEAAVSEGTVQGINEKNKSFQMSARMGQPNSGSPVFNMKGEVVGAVIVQYRKDKTLNFAVSIRGIAKQLGRYTKPKKVPESNISSPEPRKEAAMVEKTVDDAQLYFYQGIGYDQSNMYNQAIDAYRQSLKIKPDFVDAYINLGIDYYELGEYESAISAFKKAIRIKPDLLTAYNKLGVTYIICGEYSKAVDTFKKVLAVDPNNISAHYNLGIAYFLNGDVSGAHEERLILKDVDKERADSLSDLIN